MAQILTNRPEVSVLITSYNYGAYLREASESVEQQTYPNWEIILVDDCSTDNTSKIAKELKRKLGSRFKLIKNSISKGVSRSRNIALKASKGRYIAFLDGDDRWHPTKLEKQMKLFDTAGKSINMIHTGVEVFTHLDDVEWLKNSNTRVKGLDHWNLAFNYILLKLLKRHKGNYFNILRQTNPICLSSVMIKRQDLLTVEGFDEGLWYQVEDWLLWLKCSLLFKIQFLPDKLTYYRVHPKAYTSRVFIRQEYPGDISRGQLHDRCLMFAERKGLKLSYRELQQKSRIKILLEKALNGGKRFLERRLRNKKPKEILNKGVKKSRGNQKNLDQLILFTTSKCNLSCKGCFYAEKLNSKDDMSFGQIKSIANSAGKPKFVLLTGGEPFRRKDIGQIIQLFIKDCDVGINTNGFTPNHMKKMLIPVLSKKLAHNLTVSVSIDGFEATHNKMRGNNKSYLRALDTLRMLFALRKKYPKLAIVVNTLISPANLGELVDFAKELATRFSLDYHNFEIERGNIDTTKKLLSQSNILLQVYEEILGIISRYYPHTYFVSKARFNTQYFNLVEGRPWKFPCLAGKKSVVICSNGMLAACEMRPRKIDLANFDYNLSTALNSKSMRQEIEQITKDKCFCTHGCWLLISMNNYLARKYGSLYRRIIFKYLKAVDWLKILINGKTNFGERPF